MKMWDRKFGKQGNKEGVWGSPVVLPGSTQVSLITDPGAKAKLLKSSRKATRG